MSQVSVSRHAYSCIRAVCCRRLAGRADGFDRAGSFNSVAPHPIVQGWPAIRSRVEMDVSWIPIPQYFFYSSGNGRFPGTGRNLSSECHIRRLMLPPVSSSMAAQVLLLPSLSHSSAPGSTRGPVSSACLWRAVLPPSPVIFPCTGRTPHHVHPKEAPDTPATANQGEVHGYGGSPACIFAGNPRHSHEFMAVIGPGCSGNPAHASWRGLWYSWS
jgi:hypothetical protein